MEPNISQQNENTSSAFLPVLLIALSILIFVTWQFSMVWKQQSNLKAVHKSRSELVTKSQAIQNDLQKLAVGVIDLARAGDADAVALVQKYGIAQTQPPK